jgi:hypothetical protein|tara:strand:+ start:853 stop:1071 length:219 start_codon:yes stop_codon:yes gene_type:complete
MQKQLLKMLGKFDLTELFKGKGDLKRWSSKRTIGGVIVTYALYSMDGLITPYGVILCFIGVLPLCLSFLEKD